jgi:hypothetical protein
MKKLLIATTLFALGASLALAQTGGDKEQSPKVNAAKTSSSIPTAKTELNPQPLPPGATSAAPKPAGSTKLNPQPLPPRKAPKTARTSNESTAK